MLKTALVGFPNMNENIWGLVEKLSGWGYKALENGQFLLKGDVKENLKRIADIDFSVLSVGADINGLQNKIDDIISTAKSINVDKVCCYGVDAQTFEEAANIAKIFDKAGEKLRSEGLFFCYHNHDHEFKKSFNGIRFFDILMAEASPENLFANLDVGWASVGGENVPQLVKRLGGRIKMMHFKDFYDLDNRDSFTALGTGKVKIQEILAEASKIGIDYITVEQDRLRNLNFDDTVLASYLILKESGLVE